MRHVHVICLLAAWCCVSALPGSAAAERAIGVAEAPKQGTGGRRWAVIIGVNNYLHVPHLRYAVADAKLLCKTLRERAGFDTSRVLLLTDDQPQLKDKPIRSNILDQLATFLEFPAEDDTVVVFFSGHGFKDEKGSGYLAPQDAKKTSLALTCVPIAEVKRLIGACKARQKVLILDTCHAGTAKGPAIEKDIAVDAAKLVEQVAGKGFVTLASCGPDQESHESPKLAHGVFTYCLAQGLEGKADRDRDGWIDFDELYRYSWDKTRLRVWEEFRRKQEPLKDVRVQGVLVLAKARPGPPPPTPPRPAVARSRPARPLPPLNPPRPFTNSIGMKLVHTKRGTFLMGSPAGEKGRDDDEGPTHRATISTGFYISVYEVTQGQYGQVMGTNPARFQMGQNYPVEQVSWHKAVEFCKKLSAMEGKAYRLPTETEWEYACRAGSTTRFSFGDSDAKLGEYAWFWHESGKPTTTHPVGQKRPNGWGVYDMHGSVWEWCQDGYGAYSAGTATDPCGSSTGDSRVVRGGSYLSQSRFCRSAVRFSLHPSSRNYQIGFRVVIPVSP